jgi:dCTP diphosphatase
MGIDSTQDLLAHSDVVEPRWRSEVKGQASGISWKYLLMLAGQSGVKPDRMVMRFMQRMGAGVDMSPDDFVLEIVKQIGREGIDATAVDHRIWSIERDTTTDDFSDLRAEVNHFAYEREWDQFHSVKNLFLALVGEMGEVAELIQWKSDDEIEDYLKTSDGNARMSEELADVFIYLMRLAEKAGVDLTQVTYKKLSINEKKYSVSSSRGNATKYNERP